MSYRKIELLTPLLKNPQKVLRYRFRQTVDNHKARFGKYSVSKGKFQNMPKMAIFHFRASVKMVVILDFQRNEAENNFCQAKMNKKSH